MRKFLKNLTNKFIKPIGLTAHKTKDLDFLHKQYRDLTSLYSERHSVCHKKSSSPASSACLVFSKDRAMQLHALLSSYFELVTNPAPVNVLYQVSSPLHNESYKELAYIFTGYPVKFHKQHDNKFKEDLINILSNQKSDKVFFLVDDMIFVEKINLKIYTAFDTDIFVPSLRLGGNLSFCYTQQAKQPLPSWLDHPQCPSEMLIWSWQNSKFDWAYPLSVDGHLFGRWEILAMTKLLDFAAPNTFEMALQQFIDIFETRIGVAFQKSVVVNIPWNKVQSEHDNMSGNIHQDFLLNKWQAGKQIDYQKLYGLRNISAHQEVSPTLIVRGASDLVK